ncbi:hypothetical protein GCM10011495_22180 [Hymenobacter frigidus]|uniref:Uncharacterized protein n=1 Tax=Hymenobacter frigidus TaxID=1524095 RepID=A0ABQ2A917_9BACT|nr:hypothetical protein GCM10011495_22180 [Hymenobacter frigidus]
MQLRVILRFWAKLLGVALPFGVATSAASRPFRPISIAPFASTGLDNAPLNLATVRKLALQALHQIQDTNGTRAVSKFVYVGDVAWTLQVRARPGRHADSQSPRYTYTNPGTALRIDEKWLNGKMST